TIKILSALSPFTPNAVRLDLEHWSLGYPYAIIRLPSIPGVPALILLGVGLVVTAGGLLWRAWGGEFRRPTAKIWLVFLLMLSTPVGEALVCAVGNHIIGVRDLAASWPFLALFGAALVLAA